MGDGTFYIAIPDHSDRKELAAEVRRYRLILEKDQFTFSEIPEEDA